MNHFKIYGLNCTRLVRNEIFNDDYFENLKKKNDYIYLISYQKKELKDFRLMEKVTPIIRTTFDKEKIYRNFNKTTRNEINKTLNNRNLLFKYDDNNNEEIYRLHVNFENSQGRMPLLKRDILKSKIFSAYYNNNLITSMACIEDDNIMRLAQIASMRNSDVNNDLKKIISNASRRIMFEICKYCNEKNYQFFDLGIVNLNDKSKKGVVNFKMSFTNELINTYIYRFETKKFLSIRSYINDKFKFNIH